VERRTAPVLIWILSLQGAALLDGAGPRRIDAIARRCGACRLTESRDGDEAAKGESGNERAHIPSSPQAEAERLGGLDTNDQFKRRWVLDRISAVLAPRRVFGLPTRGALRNIARAKSNVSCP
jgi:hypothetical protein